MNALESFLKLTNGDETFYMNLLQSSANSPVSDLCVNAADVWRDDAERAVKRIIGKDLAGVERWVRGGEAC